MQKPVYELQENAVHISKDLAAIFIGAWLSVNGFIAVMAIKNSVEIAAINKAVNHVEKGKNTLREDVTEIRKYILDKK